MSSKIKNILIFLGIALILILAYVFIFQKEKEEPSLVSTSGGDLISTNQNQAENEASIISQDFLAVLLNIKNIKIDDSLFSDPVFSSLKDSSIELISDGNEGRPNPFAPLGVDLSPVNPIPIVEDLINKENIIEENTPEVLNEVIPEVIPVNLKTKTN